ncbi:hypothetical protein ACLEPN_02970 [Myxococcus sp. 1LA]
MLELINRPQVRKKFEADPIGMLNKVGIQAPESLRDRISPESIDTTLSELIEGSEADPRMAALIVAPGVAPAVRVGTRPGTSPGVRVGVQVGTGTSTFAEPRPKSRGGKKTPEKGLSSRQAAQRKKRKDRAK